MDGNGEGRVGEKGRWEVRVGRIEEGLGRKRLREKVGDLKMEKGRRRGRRMHWTFSLHSIELLNLKLIIKNEKYKYYITKTKCREIFLRLFIIANVFFFVQISIIN